ncbi:hypothetical protein Murru_0770 [Allomuricauda ruestringensis DSM 13258]|uniref:Uncharacterized protein n=1 Tax=Allomuricauda ruestringensis (strain DSM 13258 / CIP 107369 / LMG 19739 / B1) TaxID=886377 RepID=G2PJR1_ALLRU|nr:hypothetical protein [Allomuricauda ruestringensis]AEM69819.1 hypothetical protein Murru_0770 [Allomuricauda ruestringensis DSM 13258]
MLDKKAKQILFKSFWKNGWIDSKDRQLSIEDFEYAKSKGLMFEPLTINHNEAIDKLISIRDKISSENISEAFLSSLSSKRLDLRSPISSYFLAKKISKHKYSPVISGTSYERGKPKFHSYTCGICKEVQYGVIGNENYENQDLNVLNFERLKWGGVRHGELIYMLFDLQQFEREQIQKPLKEDVDIFKNILKVIETSNADDYPGKLETRLKSVLKSSKSERQVLIEILAAIEILKPKRFDRPIKGKDDWTFVGYWRGEDKYDLETVKKYFGSYFK